jgi:osmotically-inducible protein OsmY
MLVVVLSNWEIENDGSASHASSKQAESSPITGHSRATPLPDDVLDSFFSRTGWLKQCGYDCRIATRIPDAVALMSEQHFDVVLFDLIVFDGKTHRLISHLNDSTACLFSRLDVEGGCWWLPAEISRNGYWRTQTLWSRHSDQLLKEIYRQLAWAMRENSKRNPALIEQQLLDTHSAKRVFGVQALAVELEVVLPNSTERTDSDIAEAAERALEWTAPVPRGRVQVMVEHGWLTLQGKVDSEYQRSNAEFAVRGLLGLKGISNEISVVPPVTPNEIKTKIAAALKRSAILDASLIEVRVNHGTVILSGNVHSWAEREEAEHAAWAAPGVSEVKNLIQFDYALTAAG